MSYTPIYITEETLIRDVGEKELIARTDRNKSGVINSEVLEGKIQTAETEVDGFLRGYGYALPLSQPVDPIIPSLATDVARWYLWKGARIPEEVETNYKAAVARLKDIQAGRLMIKLGDTDPFPSQSMVSEARDKVFDDAGLSGY